MSKMSKMNKLSASIAAGLSLIVSANVFAAADLAGDSLISLPKNETTVTSASVDIWFVEIDGATAYTLDLVGAGPGTAYGAAAGELGAVACDNTSVANRTYEKKMIIPADSLDCGQETASTKPGDGDLAGVHLCKWTTPDLADGVYAVAINPVFTGDTARYSSAEIRTAATCAGDDATGYLNNVGVTTIALAATTTLNSNYQRFTVVAAAGAATAIPTTPIPLFPASGSILSTSANAAWNLTFVDNSGANNLSTWYELWIYDRNNNRINSLSDNPTYKHWYKNTVDSELSCTTTNALGHRICDISLIVADGVNIINTPGTDADGGATVASGDTLTWWVKGYNSKGATIWSAPATFKVD